MTESMDEKILVQIEEMPDVQGLTFRRFRGEVDYPLMQAVLQGSKDADGLERIPTIEDLTLIYSHLDNCDPYKDMLFSEVDGQVIGFNRVWWELEYNGEYIYTLVGTVLPEWRCKGIGTAMLHHSEDRIRKISSEHPSEPHKFFQSWASEKEVDFLNMMNKENYQIIRYFIKMTRPISDPIPEAPMPAGLEVRSVKEDEYRKVFTANDEGFRDHWGHVPLTENDYQKLLESPRFNPKIWKVAWDGDEVAGMVLNFVDEKENQDNQRERGYTEEIVVQRPYRQRGLAKALIAQSIAMFRDLDMDETALSVDAENLSGALNLYEYMGYKTEKRTTVFRKPLQK